MIRQIEIVAMNFIKTVPEVGRSWRATEEVFPSNDRLEIDLSINLEKNYQYKYFDKWGNMFTFEEIIKN
jgi:hypothetical protein